MKVGDLFWEEWYCLYSSIDPCYASEKNPPGHAECGYRHVTNLKPEEYDLIKDMEIE